MCNGATQASVQAFALCGEMGERCYPGLGRIFSSLKAPCLPKQDSPEFSQPLTSWRGQSQQGHVHPLSGLQRLISLYPLPWFLLHITMRVSIFATVIIVGLVVSTAAPVDGVQSAALAKREAELWKRLASPLF